MNRRALLLINPESGKTKQEIPAAMARLKGHGFSLAVEATREVGRLAAAIRQQDRDVDLVVIAAGDGTINAMIEPLLERGLPFGILPAGTANDLARTLGIPDELTSACDIIAAGHRQRIDLGLVNGKHFFNVASIGLSVQVTHRLSPSLKKKIGVLSYVYGVLKSVRSHRPFRAEIVVNGRVSRVRTIQISVGNGRYYGGGMAVAEDAAISDHRLDLYSLQPLSFWKLLLLAPALRRGTHGQEREKVKFLHGREILVTTPTPMPVDTDGEVTTSTPAHFQVVPEAVEVFVPLQSQGKAKAEEDASAAR